jgi:hypothetical protein
MRKVIQIITGMTGSPYMNGTKVEHSIYALCDDGTMWKTVGDNWYRLHDIPQDKPVRETTVKDGTGRPLQLPQNLTGKRIDG